MSSYPIETEDVSNISECRVATTASIGPTGQLQTRTVLQNVKSLRGQSVIGSVQGFNETREVEWSVKFTFSIDDDGNFVIDEDIGFEGNALGNTHFISVQHTAEGEPQEEENKESDEYTPLLSEPPEGEELEEEEQREEYLQESKGEEYPEEQPSHGGQQAEKEIPAPHYLSEKEVEDTITGMTEMYKAT